MSEKFSFISPILQQIDSEAEAAIVLHLQKIKQISDDIKTLAEKLKNAAIPFDFFYVFWNEKEKCNNLIVYKDHFLVWNRSNKQLNYDIYVAEDEIEEFYHPSGEIREQINEQIPQLKTSILLCETKVSFRLKIEKELPDFYKKIIASLRSEASQTDCIIGVSPNYNAISPRKIKGITKC